MTISQSDMQTLQQQIDAFNSYYFSTKQNLDNFVAAGTVLYNNPKLVEMFPSSSAAYKAALAAAGTSINTFKSTFPTIPNLNG